MGIQNPKFEPGAIRRASVQPGEDGRIPCALEVRPRDEDAVKHGFKDAFDWYVYSTGGDNKDPKMVKQQFDQLPQEISSDDESLSADEHMREFFRRTTGIKKDWVTGELIYDD